MTQCRDQLGNLRCTRDGGHNGPHRAGMTLWAARMPEWLRRAQDRPNGLARDLTGKVAL